MMEKIDAIEIAKVGEVLILVTTSEGQHRLQVVGSSPPAFRRIRISWEPTLLIDGHSTSMTWLPGAGGAWWVSTAEKFVRFKDLPNETKVEIVSYAISEETWATKLAADIEAEPKAPYVLDGSRGNQCTEFSITFGRATLDDQTAINHARESLAYECETARREGSSVSATLWKGKRIVANFPTGAR